MAAHAPTHPSLASLTAAAAVVEQAPLAAPEARLQAKAEGLTLLRTESNASGFQGVHIDSGNKSRPYQARVRRGGKLVYLGHFATAEEAALARARTPEGTAAAAAAAAAPAPLTAAEARRQAEAEGLTLLRSESSASGFQCVTIDSSRSKIRPYKAQVRRDGKMVYLGMFATAEEAALAFARSPEGGTAAAAAAATPAPLTAAEALRQAEAEGLTLLRSENNTAGFQGVRILNGKAKPFRSQVQRGGKEVSLGYFATAEEAALAYARTPEGKAASAAAAAAPVPLTAAEARRQAEAEGLTLQRAENNATGFQSVHLERSSKTKPYLARVHINGEKVSLGYFATPEEAALAVARSPEGRAAAAAAAVLSAGLALRANHAAAPSSVGISASKPKPPEPEPETPVMRGDAVAKEEEVRPVEGSVVEMQVDEERPGVSSKRRRLDCAS